MLTDSTNQRALIYTGGTVTRAVHATGKMPGAIVPVRGAGAQLAAAALNAGTDTFAQAAGTDADANADLSVFQGINPQTGALFSPQAMHIGRYDALLHGFTFLTATGGTVSLRTFGSANADAKTILTLSQTATAFAIGRYTPFGPHGILVPGGFYLTTATLINDIIIHYSLVPAR